MSDSRFPKAMATRKAERWLDANNPHPAGTYEHFQYAAKFWGDQSDKLGRRAETASRISLTLALVALVILLGSLIVEAVAS